MHIQIGMGLCFGELGNPPGGGDEDKPRMEAEWADRQSDLEVRLSAIL